MQKYVGRELAAGLSGHEVQVRRDEVVTQFIGGNIATFWTERTTMTVEDFTSLLAELGPEPREFALLEAIGIPSEGAEKGSLSFVYGVDPRNGMRASVHLRWRAMSVDVPDVYLAALAVAAKATVNS